MAIGRRAFCAAILACVRLLSAHDVNAEATGDPHKVAAAVASAKDVVATPADEVTIYLVRSTFHSDLVIPRAAFNGSPAPIRAAVARAGDGPWIIVGWGPFWFGRDLRGGPYHAPPVRAVTALWSFLAPQLHSRIRLAALPAPGAAPGEDPIPAQPILISPANLDRVIGRINASFVSGPDGGPVLADEAGVAEGVSLYQSHEIYHIVHECNHWASEALHAGGIHTVPILDGLPVTLNLDLKLHGAFAPDVAPRRRLADGQGVGERRFAAP